MNADPTKTFLRRAGWVLVLVVLAGCASTKVTQSRPGVGQTERLPRPDRILVYRFAVTPAELPAGSATAQEASAPSQPPTPEELEVGRRLGEAVATQLVEEIRAMGIPAVRGEREKPRLHDIAIRGYFASIDRGSALERIAVGFGSGSAALTTVVEGYQMTEQGMRRLGSATVESGANKTPGMVVPLAVTIATANPIGLAVGGAVKLTQEATGSGKIEASGKRTAHEIAKELRVRFQKQGWIDGDR